jgi:hypothetical protein|mmetsp:Transcript_6345/g.23930  ORF Transcript_6345/g.23930 Transcript_6345/m.23930 type:complete len:131 (+) Transcript_6345:180-572(+)
MVSPSGRTHRPGPTPGTVFESTHRVAFFHSPRTAKPENRVLTHPPSPRLPPPQVKKFAQKQMKTSDVRVDVKLNKAIWSKGIRNVPRRLRIQISRRRNDDEDAEEDLYSYVTVAPEQNFAGVGTKVVDDA